MNTAPALQHADPYLEGAQAIGLRLCRDAIWAGSRCTWLGSSMELINGTWMNAQKPAGAELYAGTAGIALFLAELYAMTGDASLRKAALGGAALARSMAENWPIPTTLGFYSGLTGAAYALIRIGQALGESSLIDHGLSLFDSMVTLELDTALLDVISGCAGAIPILLRLHAEFNRPALFDLAQQCGHHLLATAHANGETLSWNTLGSTTNGTAHLTGFSHGTAGIGWSLTELSIATGEKEFHEAAQRAFAYERQLFSPEHGNWPDLRSAEGQPGAGSSYALAWCHGAPGIGLARLRTYAMTDEAACHREAEVAVATTMQNLRYSMDAGAMNFSLCHGLCGNADLLLEADRALGRSDCRTLAEQLGAKVLAHAATGAPWPCGVQDGGETPGLLLGTAGIGYFLLRLARPDLESILIVGQKPDRLQAHT